MVHRIVNCLIILFLLAPLIAIIGSSFTETALPRFPPKGFTLAWYKDVFADPGLMAAAGLSLKLGLVSALVSGALGATTALAIARSSGTASKVISTLVLSPILFPTVVLGLALLIFFTNIGLASSFLGLVIAHSILTTPFVIRLTLASLADFDISIEEAARNLGAGPMRALFLVTLPLIAPDVIAGMLFAFILSFDELVVTLFLSGPHLQTLPVRIFNILEYHSKPTIAAVSSLIILTWLVIGLPLYARFVAKKKENSH